MKKYLLLALVLVLVVGAFLASQFTSMVSIPGAINEGLEHGGATCYQIIRANGMTEDLGCRHNLFMDDGKRFLANQTGTNPSTNKIDEMWLGNSNFSGGSSAANFDSGTTVYGDGTYGLNASNCTGFHLGNWAIGGTGVGNITASCLWTAAQTATVWSTALNCSDCSESTEFFAVNNFTTVATLGVGDQLNVTWYVWSS